MPEPRKVVIIGGGVAGLTAAHELKERGFRVTVYERQRQFGGKARSGIVKKGADDILDLPAEHGFRFFPGFYRHLIDTLGRIPAPGAGRHVLDSLVDVPRGVIAQADKSFCLFPTKGPHGIRSGLQFFRNMLANPSLGLGAAEAAIAAVLLVNAMTTCDERREAELDNVTWWDYMRADEMSDQYRRVVINGLTQNFVAMDAKKTSMRTAITILARLLQDFLGGRGLDRVLNGPTSEVWIEPWVAYLGSEREGRYPVSLVPDKPVRSFLFDEDSSRITGLQMADGELHDPEAIYIAAVPVEAMIKLLQDSPQAILEHSPTLKLLYGRHLQVSWMSGVMFYLKQDVPMAPGHVIYLDSNWAITSISQNQFWAKKVSGYGQGKVHGIVSAIISDWTMAGNGGVFSEPAQACDGAQQVAKEALAEIRLHLREETGIDLSDENIADFYLDPDIKFDKRILQKISGVMPAVDFVGAAHDVMTFFAVRENLEPLFINTAGSWVYRPTEATDIENLFLASDYVKTNTDLATMEGANEAGRRAVNRILDLCRTPGRRCRVFEFDEPLLFAPWKSLDRAFFKLGLPHP